MVKPTGDTPPPLEASDEVAGGEQVTLLEKLGRRIRERRERWLLSRREVSEKAGVSERFLVLLENGEANVSVLNLASIALALGTSPSILLEGLTPDDPWQRPYRQGLFIALLGLRGAGKTTIGSRAADRLEMPFVELDKRVAERAGMSLSEIFEMHGSGFFRKLEREEIEVMAEQRFSMIIATSGGIVTDHETFEVLRRVAVTVWLRAKPEDHYQRVLEQGDARPMASRPDAMEELRSLLRARRALYERASHVIDTSALGLERSIDKLVKIVNQASRVRLRAPRTR